MLYCNGNLIYASTNTFLFPSGDPLVPPPTTPTPRPIPEMEESDKALAEGVTRTACFVLIGCLAVTLLIFAIFRIMNHGRFIHMNIEFSLLCAHLCLLPNFVGDEVSIFTVLYTCSLDLYEKINLYIKDPIFIIFSGLVQKH